MAQRVEVTLVDDLDGSPAERTVTFALDGQEFEIDLNGQHMKELFAAIDPWVDKARPVGRTRTRSTRSERGEKKRRAPRQSPAAYDPEVVRAWAKANGHAVSDRGRIRAEVIEAWTDANP